MQLLIPGRELKPRGGKPLSQEFAASLEEQTSDPTYQVYSVVTSLSSFPRPPSNGCFPGQHSSPWVSPPRREISAEMMCK